MVPPIPRQSWLLRSPLRTDQRASRDAITKPEKCWKRTFLISFSSSGCGPGTSTCHSPKMTRVGTSRPRSSVPNQCRHEGIDLGRLPNLWRRTWHTRKNGPTTDGEHRGGLELAGERSNNSFQVVDINAISELNLIALSRTRPRFKLLDRGRWFPQTGSPPLSLGRIIGGGRRLSFIFPALTSIPRRSADVLSNPRS
jgi:hypothetical protein